MIVNNLEENIKELFNYCFHAINYGNLINECAVLLLGSFATGMATLYSDIEYFVLIRDEKHKNSCFRVAYLFNIIIQSLGENKDLLDDVRYTFNSDYDEIAQYVNKYKGLSIDASKNRFSDDLFCQFIDTPKGSLGRLSNSNYMRHEPSNHTTSSFLTTKFLDGNEKLYNEYKTIFTNCLLKKEYFELISSLLKMDLNSNCILYDQFNSNNNLINVKRILANIIHIIRGLYLLSKSYYDNCDLDSDFFTISKILKAKWSIEESRYRKWIELIQNIYKLQVSLQSEYKSADITIKHFKEKLHNKNVKQILEEISEFVKNKFKEIKQSIAERYEASEMSLDKSNLSSMLRVISTSTNSDGSLSYLAAPIQRTLDESLSITSATRGCNRKKLSQSMSNLTLTETKSSCLLLLSRTSTQPEKDIVSIEKEFEDGDEQSRIRPDFTEAGEKLGDLSCSLQLNCSSTIQLSIPTYAPSESEIDYSAEPKIVEPNFGNYLPNIVDYKSSPKVEENPHDVIYNSTLNGTDTKLQNGLGIKYYYGNDELIVDYDRAAKLFTAAAKQNCRTGRFNLGNCFYHGHGVVKDYNQAVEWYTNAATKGNLDAQNTLVNCYKKGKSSVSRNLELAVNWFSKAANKGLASAQFNLGACYRNKESVSQNYEKVLYWYTKADNQNHYDAQYYLGLCYEKGFGVSVELDAAIQWYTVNAQNNYTQASKRLKEKFGKSSLSLKY